MAMPENDPMEQARRDQEIGHLIVSLMKSAGITKIEYDPKARLSEGEVLSAKDTSQGTRVFEIISE